MRVGSVQIKIGILGEAVTIIPSDPSDFIKPTQQHFRRKYITLKRYIYVGLSD